MVKTCSKWFKCALYVSCVWVYTSICMLFDFIQMLKTQNQVTRCKYGRGGRYGKIYCTTIFKDIFSIYNINSIFTK